MSESLKFNPNSNPRSQVFRKFVARGGLLVSTALAAACGGVPSAGDVSNGVTAPAAEGCVVVITGEGGANFRSSPQFMYPDTGKMRSDNIVATGLQGERYPYGGYTVEGQPVNRFDPAPPRTNTYYSVRLGFDSALVSETVADVVCLSESSDGTK